MEETEVVRSFMEGRDVQQKLAAKRKRVRSGDPDNEDPQDVLDVEHVTKKMSVSEMDALNRKGDRVALLDAGSQYGKVHCAEGGSVCLSVPRSHLCRS